MVVRRSIGTVLLLAGSAAMLWCLTVLGGAALYQKLESWRFDHKIAASPVPGKSVQFIYPAPKLHALLGRLEIPRLHVSTMGCSKATMRIPFDTARAMCPALRCRTRRGTSPSPLIAIRFFARYDASNRAIAFV